MKTDQIPIFRLQCCLILLLVSLSACGQSLNDPFTETEQAKANEDYTPSDMMTALDQILLWHQTNQTGLDALLNPGTEATAIDDEFSELPCQPTEELIQLWTWRNGTQAASTPFIWYHNFLSVEDALMEYQRLTGNPLIGWRENWIPVFTFEGEWYFVVCFEENQPASTVGYYSLEGTEAIYAYTSLTKMLQTAAELFAQKAVIWDVDNEGMSEDMKAVYEIHQRLNEGAQFPYYVD